MDILQATAIARPNTTERGQRFISKVIGYSFLLQTLMNFKIKPTEHQYRPSAGSQSLAGRAKSSNYTPESLTPADLQAGELSLHGFFVEYDLTYKADHDLGHGIHMDEWYEDELDNRAYDTALAIDKYIISSDGSGNTMKGIAAILDGVTNVPGLGITMVIDALAGSGLAGDSFDLSVEANYSIFLEQLKKWKKEVHGANAIICNSSMVGRLTTIATKYHCYSQTTDEFGNAIEKVDGLKLIEVDDSVITNAEPDNGGPAVNNTTSIYIIRNTEGLWNVNTNSGLAFYDHGELSGKLADGILFDFRANNEIKQKRGIRRARNIKL